MNGATWIKTVEDGIARVPTKDEKRFGNMWLTWSADSGFTTVNKNFHKFYQKLSKFTSTLI